MSLEDEIRRDIHGEPIDLRCDLRHDTRAPAVSSESILLDVIRVDNVPAFERLSDPPDGWVTDVLRCEDHYAETITLPTDGYDEALVWVDTVATAPPGSRTAIDASDLVVVAHSPSAHGADPPPVDGNLCLQAATKGDFGFPRISRQQAILPRYRSLAQDVTADLIEQQVSKARAVARSEETA